MEKMEGRVGELREQWERERREGEQRADARSKQQVSERVGVSILTLHIQCMCVVCVIPLYCTALVSVVESDGPMLL